MIVMSRSDLKQKTTQNLDAQRKRENGLAFLPFSTTVYGRFSSTTDEPVGMSRGTAGTFDLIEIADKRLQVFEKRLELIERRMEAFESTLAQQPGVVLVEEMSREEAKRRIESFFESHSEADTEELMRNLRIDLPLLVELLDELKREGKIASVGSP